MRKQRMVFLFVCIVVIVFGFAYVSYTWNCAKNEASREVLAVVKTAAALLHQENVQQLSCSEKDVGTRNYEHLKDDMQKIVAINNSIRFAYLLSQRDGKIYFLVDSEIPGSEDYSPPGQELVEADKTIFRIFESGEAIITEPIMDRWGTWVSALVPIKGIDGKVIAVMGADYPAKKWDNALRAQTLPSVLVFCALLIFLSITFILIDRKANKKMQLERISFDLPLVIKSCASSFEAVAREKGLSFDIRISDALPRFVFGDPARLSQALDNVLENAIKFTMRGGVALTASVNFNGEIKPDEVSLLCVVEDTGVGMSKESIKALFTPFSEREALFEGKYQDRGLGFIIYKSIVESMGGQVSVESVPDKGTKVSFTVILNTKSPKY